jgi:hypothetical protein
MLDFLASKLAAAVDLEPDGDLALKGVRSSPSRRC